ncbi:urea carboxylase [Neolentinus lepideus HHB14362 ss-1]|uniref:Urea carboxylase n=1 Tax=Neolentinus lepideus HHB14362 ss-1 TaxID=1314782 RepID=A0A165P4V2_9AGAM|nr:urea carboxylase [Neolentinus lepideus HHB14362 ss-1]
MAPEYSKHKLLVANRGEIAVRILRTAKRLSIPTVSIYTPSDALSPHVSLADESYPMLSPLAPHEALPDAQGYLDTLAIVDICKKQGVTLVHPGYGFLSENTGFARMVRENGATFLGPSAEIVEMMGLKHEARRKAIEADVPVVPGSDGLVASLEDAVELAMEKIGYPVMLKSTAGGGGMGIVVCENEAELRNKFEPTTARAQVLFHNSGVFIEKYFPAARHIEVQVFGDGLGHAIHMGERECSVQRRHQKVIEETPSPFMAQYPGLRERMCDAAVRLCKAIKYGSAGTVEFLVDDKTGEFFFLEMNTRLQVEHPITEVTRPGLDIVEMMIRQGIAESESKELELESEGVPADEGTHAIEARAYCENPAAGFKPAPGVLQYVQLPAVEGRDWLRIDGWISTGTTVTPFFDPLVCKVIVSGSTREEAVQRMIGVLDETKIMGPANNIPYLKAICESDVFKRGDATTKFLDTFEFVPRAMDVLSPGLDMTIQDYPGRLLGLGIPRGGPMDTLAFRAANILVSNPPGTEAFEMLPLTTCRLMFHVPAVIAVTGADVDVTINSMKVGTWEKVIVQGGTKVVIGRKGGAREGCRVYIAVRGGFPQVPEYLGSKSTSAGMGGYQGRTLAAGDHLALGECGPKEGEELVTLPPSLIPRYPLNWTIHCLSGPHDSEEFVTSEGIERFYANDWKVSASSNRMGIRLEGPKILWSRSNGGEGGSHPSNVHDNGYALGTVNVNGDTPVILTSDGPDMGGYMCFCTVASGDYWKLGQVRAGDTIRFRRVTFQEAMRLIDRGVQWLEAVKNQMLEYSAEELVKLVEEEDRKGPILKVIDVVAETGRPRVVFRQAGDAAILVEYGDLYLDLALRARIHAFETTSKERQLPGIWAFGPCIRSTIVRYDPAAIAQSNLLSALVDAELSLPDTMESMSFPGRRITFPIVLDDRWNREALERYMKSIRDRAVYLPSNIDYLARNNGVKNAEEALVLLTRSAYLVFGVGFYLACPFLVPVDPRCRIVGQKMNPSRTYTPRGAIGIAGLVAAIYPMESPGGYQLYGRSLPAWQTWGRGQDFSPAKPWLLEPFDQVVFEPVTEEDYVEIEKLFDAGRYKFKVEPATFSIAEYNAFVKSVQPEIEDFRRRQAEGTAAEEIKEAKLLEKWEIEKAKATSSSSGEAVTEASDDTGEVITSSLSATIWKIHCKPGDVVESPEQVMMILEAMKTEINIEAGEECVGKKVKGFGSGVREGKVVKPGDVLAVLE